MWRIEKVRYDHCPRGCYIFRNESANQTFHASFSWFWGGKAKGHAYR